MDIFPFLDGYTKAASSTIQCMNRMSTEFKDLRSAKLDCSLNNRCVGLDCNYNDCYLCLDAYYTLTSFKKYARSDNMFFKRYDNHGTHATTSILTVHATK